MMDNDIQQVQQLKQELLEMKAKFKDAIENKKKYEDCLQKVAADSAYLDLFVRLTNYFLDEKGF